MAAKVLVFDIETAPILGYVWGLFDQNISLNQIHSDWHIMAWAAKWLGGSEMFYMDQRNAKDISNDKDILKGLWNLLDEADVVITQNGKKFDAKKANARFIIHGMKPPSSFKHIDTLQMARASFGFTSNKLEYMSKSLNKKYKKLDHGKYPGFQLWRECITGNLSAWKEMEKYNKHDVLATEELYKKLAPWGCSVDFNLFNIDGTQRCSCGAVNWKKNGYAYTSTGRYQRFKCHRCGAEGRDSENKFSKSKRQSLLRKVSR